MFAHTSSVLPPALESCAHQNTSLFPGKHMGDTNRGAAGVWSCQSRGLELPRRSWRDTILHTVPQNNLLGVLSHSPSGFPPLISKSGGEYSNYRAGSGKKHALGAKSPSLAALRAEATSCQHISTPQALGGRGHALPRGRVHALSSPPPPAGRRGQGAQPGQPQRLTIHLRTPGRCTRIFTHQSLPPPGM